jgi:hemerythrin-like domain-containing protein
MIDSTRRTLVATLGLGLLSSTALGKTPNKPAKKDDDDVGPTEDLMREHGILRRVLGVYDEVVRRAAAREPIPAEPLAAAAQVVRDFMEDYHERDEEDYVFPRIEKAGQLVELISILRAQHQTGRRLTDAVRKLATPAQLQTPAGARKVADTLAAFCRMYRAHAAREDTIVFPAFRVLAGAKELDRIKDVFEAKEKALPRDFEKMVVEVARIEEQFGIADLAIFTPRE